MSSRNIWNNNINKNITQTINRKNLKFILEGETTTDNQNILKFVSASPIIMNLHGYQTQDDVTDSTYFKTILYSESFDYTTEYKNQIIDIIKDMVLYHKVNYIILNSVGNDIESGLQKTYKKRDKFYELFLSYHKIKYNKINSDIDINGEIISNFFILEV